MQKLLLGFGVALVALTAMASPAAAATFQCNEVVTGGTYDNVTVPRDGSCTLIDSTVAGNVEVKTNAYFEAGNTDIGGKVRANRAVALFIDSESTVGRDVKADDTPEVYIFNAEVTRGIHVEDATAVVQICGNLVANGDIDVSESGTNILVGDPAADCGGNTVTNGDIEVERNFVDVIFVVRGNTVSDDLEVIRNTGPVEKIVEDNTGGDDLECYRNEEPFVHGGNTGWNERKGQCREVFTCEVGVPGVDVDDVIVPADAACILSDSTITGNVTVLEGAYFQSINTDIGGKVRATNAQTLFIDSESTVGREIKSNGTAEVYIYNSTIGRGIRIDNTAAVVQICGTTVTRGDVNITDTVTGDILVGSSDSTVGCAGNTVSNGDLRLERNVTDVEFVVSGNTVSDDLEVFRNTGAVEKTITDNTGGDDLKCFGNEEPVVATGNTGWNEVKGQCRNVLTCADESPIDVTVDEVIVPAGAVCTMVHSTIHGNVTVEEGAFFQGLGLDIGGNVRARSSGTIFLHSTTKVAGKFESDGSAEVFLYGPGTTIGRGIDIDGTTATVQICDTTVTHGDIKVTDSGTDILVGNSDPTVDCPGNTVSDGDLTLERNFTDVEFVVSSNTVSRDLEVFNNTGPVEKTITDNTGGDELECFGNELPVLATGNAFPRERGQCVEV